MVISASRDDLRLAADGAADGPDDVAGESDRLLPDPEITEAGGHGEGILGPGSCGRDTHSRQARSRSTPQGPELLPIPPCDNFHKLHPPRTCRSFLTTRMATETTLRPGEIKDILLREIEAADLHELDVEEVGTVLEVKDGIARIYGLQKAMAGEMLEVTVVRDRRTRSPPSRSTSRRTTSAPSSSATTSS